MNDTQAAFNDLSELCSDLGSMVSASELHGLLTGALASGLQMNESQWLARVPELMAIAGDLESDEKEDLAELFRQTSASLGAEDLGFFPMLPGEGTALSSRLELLGQWCQGFLAGFALSQKRTGDCGEEIADVLNDFAAIAQVDIDEEDDEDGEQAFFDVLEYVRLAAINVFLETVPAQAEAQQSQQSVNALFGKTVH